MLTKTKKAKIILTAFVLCLLYHLGSLYWFDRLTVLSVSHGKWTSYIGLGGAALAGYAFCILLSACAFCFSSAQHKLRKTMLRLTLTTLLCLFAAGLISVLSGIVAVILQMLLGNQLSASFLFSVIEIFTIALSLLLLPVGVHLFFQAGTCMRARRWRLRDMFAGLRLHYFKILCLIVIVYVIGFALNQGFSYLPDSGIRITAESIAYSIIGAVAFCVLLGQYVNAAVGEKQEIIV